MRKTLFARVALGWGLALAAPARADDAAPQIMPCLTTCASFSTEKLLTEQAAPAYTGAAQGYIDIWVNVRVVVNADGSAADAAITDRGGPRAFADQLKNWTKGWKLTPSTVDGKPGQQVAHAVWHIQATPVPGQPPKPGARPEILRAYADAGAAIAAGKADEAQAVLDKALAIPQLNLYEQGAMAYLAAPLALKRGDFAQAHDLVLTPSTYDLEQLPPDIQLNLLKARVRASFGISDAADALVSLARLKTVAGFDPNDPIIAEAALEQGALDRQTMISLAEKLPAADAADGLHVMLYRRHFEFGDISGGLDSFGLDCREQTISYKIADATDWRVPPNLSECALFIRGTPGTTFRIREMAD